MIEINQVRLYCCLILFVYGCSGSSPAQKNSGSRITVTILDHQPYCGGAKPTAQMEAGYASPLAGQEFYLKRGSTNDTIAAIATVTTDKNGRLNMLLDTGTYCLILPEKQRKF